MDKTCIQCGAIIERPDPFKSSAWAKRKFCNLQCKGAHMRGKPSKKKGMKFPQGHFGGKFCDCRICGAPTKYRYAEKLVGKVHCGSEACAAESARIKRDRLHATIDAKREAGDYDHLTGGWENVPACPDGERGLIPFMTELGFVHQYLVVTGTQSKHYRLDFAHLEKKIDVEIDGSSHRRHDRKERDAIRDEYFQSRGWTVMRFSEKEAKENPDRIKQVIAQAVGVSG